jgi:hypothetical protein
VRGMHHQRRKRPLGSRWCAANIKRSMGDIRKLIKLAGADDAKGVRGQGGMPAASRSGLNISAPAHRPKPPP